MIPVRFVLCGVAAASVTLAGCSVPYGGGASVLKSGCEEAVAQAVATNRSEASSLALASLKFQIGDLKGYMLAMGYRRLADRPASLDCHPYPLVGELTQCVATAKLCSK